MKKRIIIFAALTLVLSLVITACGGNAAPPPAEDTAPAPAPAPAPETTAPADTEDDTFAATPEVTLILTQHDPDASLPGQYCHVWADMVYEKSKGRILVEVNNGGSLAKPAESLDKVRGVR